MIEKRTIELSEDTESKPTERSKKVSKGDKLKFVLLQMAIVIGVCVVTIGIIIGLSILGPWFFVFGIIAILLICLFMLLWIGYE
jgi:membrane protein YdbS with pleckstrin-like domain